MVLGEFLGALLDSHLCLQTLSKKLLYVKPQFEIKNVLIEKFIFCSDV